MHWKAISQNNPRIVAYLLYKSLVSHSGVSTLLLIDSIHTNRTEAADDWCVVLRQTLFCCFVFNLY